METRPIVTKGHRKASSKAFVHLAIGRHAVLLGIQTDASLTLLESTASRSTSRAADSSSGRIVATFGQTTLELHSRYANRPRHNSNA